MQKKRFLAGILLFCFSASPADVVPPGIRAALNLIQPNELKGDLSFLASDALEGRYTPSPGLQIAAEFIASKFRAAGLEPGGTDGYFQVAQMVELCYRLFRSHSEDPVREFHSSAHVHFADQRECRGAPCRCAHHPV
jgi:hypothetical protein